MQRQLEELDEEIPTFEGAQIAGEVPRRTADEPVGEADSGEGPEGVVTGPVIVHVVGPPQTPGGYVKTLVVPADSSCAEMHWTARDIFDVPEDDSIHTELRMMPSNVILDRGYTLLDADIDLSSGSPSPTCADAGVFDGAIVQLYFTSAPDAPETDAEM